MIDESKNPTLLVVTPALVGGSWMVITELTAALSAEFKVVTAGLGPSLPGTGGKSDLRLPWLDYEEFGPRLVNSLFGILLYEVPLALLALLLWARYRPKIWLGNGLLSGALGIIPQRITGGHVVVSYNSYMGGAKPHLVALARLAAGNATLILANSEGTKLDLARFADPSRVRILPLVAQDVFFADGSPDELRERLGLRGQFVVLFVGRLDREKHCDFLLEVVRRMPAGRVSFVFAGQGALAPDIEALAAASENVRYAGRIAAREQLRNYYQMANVVWSYADETYLAKPAVEALASGTPIMVAEVPALLLKARSNALVDASLVPREVGWLVGLNDPQRVVTLLMNLADHAQEIEAMRVACRKHALEHYSRGILLAATQDVVRLGGKEPMSDDYRKGA